MRILALDSALSRCSAALVEDGVVRAARQVDASRGHAALLAMLAGAVLAEGMRDDASMGFDLVAVTVGPGGFTGLRTGLALAHGIALAAGVAVVGVSLGEALACALPHLGGRALWVAIDSRREEVFLEREGQVSSHPLDGLPAAGGRIAVAGDAAPRVAARLAAAGVDVMLTEARLPRARDVAAAAVLRLGGMLAPRAALPLYVDPPATHRPGRPGRPPPA